VVRIRTNLRSWGLAVLLLLVARSAAHPASPDGGQDLTPTARELSDQALRQYQKGELDAAIESFMGAFALSNNPGLLFNVAQAYRLKGDCEHARDYYQRYLGAVPETPFKPSLERRVAEMEACLKNRPATATVAGGDAARRGVASAVTTAATTTPRPALPTPELASPPPESSRARRAVVWTLRGSAVALLATSAVFGALTWNAYRDIDDAATMRAAWDANDRYRIDSALAWTFAATGAACAVISYFVGRHR
jgi:tetratricopeptide (TPR) repeat protein